ncbi:single-stranded-DNA-specific exonuclease RecJ [Lachnoclostridium sp. An131]|uniref:single-stranded-DNA-specific exonuclease RecJ n=1 Tax=Lachnoclostridium sp. An131 TaxID=1965555 RepID=UPI000B379811|nr:single-stranded-DNA-specific exonuclease RecJ [Lachnoclostridium sp. An131]OUQ27536.1 single-stranded-DNA-specific exonuclease RecJ [Lachnoclostridium sp. An131]
MREKWVEAPRITGNEELARKFSVSPMAMRLIRSRAGMSEEEVREYLCGTIDELADPYLMKGMRDAVSLLQEKIRQGSRIRIIGDYDIDGVNATHILITALRRIGAAADTVIPDRLKDGYGVNEHLIQDAKDAGVDTIVTCDNGIAAAKEIAFAKELGMTVIVTDHHDIPYREEEDGSRTVILPPADVIINPKQEDCPYPFKKLCGAAVAWRLAEALYIEAGISREEFLDLAEFAAVATVGDIMDLTGENRILVKYGLRRLEQTKNPGYRALIAVNGLEGKKLTAYHIGFVIGPCINASGRLDTAKRALRLLSAESKAEAEELAGDLKALNDSRKDLTVKGTREAIELIEETDLKQDRVLVVYLPDCHESLAGIIAGRIRERYYKPCFVLTDAEDGVKGSGRSIPGYHMFDEMTKVRELFTKYGGHPMAAGLSLKSENVEPFRQAINENCRLTEEELTPRLSYDAVLPLCYAGEQIIRELELLEPFGKANEKPLFAAANLKVRSARIIGKNQNVLKAVLEGPDGTRLDTISFGDVQENLAYIEGKKDVCILYYPEINEYQGRRSVQLVVESWR